MRTFTLKRSVLLGVLVAATACGVHQSDAPPLTGPSQFALAVGVTAVPDSINQDGGSQSAITVSAHDANGKAMLGVPFSMAIQVDGSPADYGTLSARTVVTGTDGTAHLVYTAPGALPNGATIPTCRNFNTPGALAGQCVSIVATPSGSDFSASQTQTVEIRLVPIGIIVPPTQTPTAQFSVSPSSPTANTPTIFDGSSSCAGPLVVVGSGTACQSNGATITSYQWNFGDGSTGSGVNVSHTFSAAQTYGVTLTVTNSLGAAASATTAVSIGLSTTGPSGTFVYSPRGPSVIAHTNTVFFDADGIQAGPGRTIVEYSWNFGDPISTCVPPAPNTASGFQATHTFCTAGTYDVVLSVADDAGQKYVTDQTVTVTP